MSYKLNFTLQVRQDKIHTDFKTFLAISLGHLDTAYSKMAMKTNKSKAQPHF